MKKTIQMKDLPDILEEDYNIRLAKLRTAINEIFCDCKSLNTIINCLMIFTAELIGDNAKKEKLDGFLEELWEQFVYNTKICSDNQI